MDFLYKRNEKNETKPVILRQYFKEYKESIESTPELAQFFKRDKGKKPKNRQRTLFGEPCSDAEFRELAERCSISKLTIPGEPEQLPDIYLNGLPYKNECKITPEDCSLQSVKYLYERMGKTPRPRQPERLFRYDNSGETSLTEYEDILVCVRVYEPFSCENKKFKESCFSEIHLLGYQTLADLRDAILCPKDLEYPGDVSENPLEALNKKGKNLFPSSFFFIEDVFYNETRYPESRDLSAVVRQWAASNGIEPLHTFRMDRIQLEEICLRFNRPYVFVHMGNCEHVVIFTTSRLLHPSDCLKAEEYPITIPLYKKNSKLCMVCHKVAAKWLVKDCDRLASATTYMCTDCFMSFGYIDGKKIGNFKAYVYIDRASLLA